MTLPFTMGLVFLVYFQQLTLGCCIWAWAGMPINPVLLRRAVLPWSTRAVFPQREPFGLFQSQRERGKFGNAERASGRDEEAKGWEKTSSQNCTP